MLNVLRCMRTRRYSTCVPNQKKEKPNNSELFIAISDLDSLGIKIDNFPSVVAVGPQSAGKSSVLDAHCGMSIFPKNMGMSTLKPMHITTIRDKQFKFVIGSKEFFDQNEAAEEVQRLNLNRSVKNISIRVHSPDIYNSYLIDLPGLFHVSKDDPTLPKVIKQMSKDALSNPNFIPLIVTAGNADPATNQGLQLLNKLNREKDALGIITKMDTVKKQNTDDIKAMLANQKFKLGHGYVAVSLRSHDEAGMTVNQKIIEETQFFADKPEFSPCGVLEMRKRISDIQLKMIKSSFPRLLESVDVEIENLSSSGSFLENLVNDPNKNLPMRLRILIEKLVGSSLERAEFEEALKHEFQSKIDGYMDRFMTDQQLFVAVDSPFNVASGIHSFQSVNMCKPADYRVDEFKELFSYGLVSPVLIDESTIKKTFNKEVALSTSVPIIEFVVDDPLGRKRLQWNKYLRSYFNTLLADQNIQNLVYEITESMILKYIYADIDSNDGLTRKFAEYIIKEIGSNAYESKIRFSIEAMINIEKRPTISLIEICRYLNQMYPQKFTFEGGFLEEMFSRKRVQIELYGEAWNKAYLKAVSAKLSENIYRNVAVNLLDIMVEKLLEVTIDMFNKDNAEKEKTRIDAKIQKLKQLKAIINNFV